jgi:hypothetical protein
MAFRAKAKKWLFQMFNELRKLLKNEYVESGVCFNCQNEITINLGGFVVYKSLGIDGLKNVGEKIACTKCASRFIKLGIIGVHES